MGVEFMRGISREHINENSEPISYVHLDYDYWAKFSEWTIDETVKILHRIEPRSNESGNPTRIKFKNNPLRAMSDMRRLISRAIRAGELNSTTRLDDDCTPIVCLKPIDFVKWATIKSIDIPHKLKELISKHSNYPNIDHYIKELEEKIQALSRVSHLPKEISPKERTSLYLIILAMAKCKYGYGSKDNVKNGLNNILTAIQSLGKNMHIDTIRDTLRKADEHLSE
ncbi:MAG: hypothetical protein WAZ18_05455 [Alphaproteobacteria bacterium]